MNTEVDTDHSLEETKTVPLLELEVTKTATTGKDLTTNSTPVTVLEGEVVRSENRTDTGSESSSLFFSVSKKGSRNADNLAAFNTVRKVKAALEQTHRP